MCVTGGVKIGGRGKVSKEEVFVDTLLSGTPAGFRCDNYKLSTCKYLGKLGDLAKYKMVPQCVFFVKKRSPRP